MFQRARTCIAALMLIAIPALGQAAITPYSQNFEGLVMANTAALSGDGWVVYGNVFSPDHSTWFYGYGTFPAPNGGTAFCGVVAGEGGAPQGAQQLSIYNDYNNGDHAAGNLVEANVFREQSIAAGDVGTTWTFEFNAKLGNLVAPSTALAFIKTIDPANGYATTNFVTANMTAIPATWNTYSVSLTIDAGLVGQLIQFGFNSTATHYVASGVYYDNLRWLKTSTTGVGDGARAGVLDLRPNTPNPFMGSTRLDFALAQRGFADIGVFDVAGRRVATLFRGVAEPGSHSVLWDGRFTDGRLAPAGVYHGALETAAGRVTRRMVLAR
jgi:hypothetical protein